VSDTRIFASFDVAHDKDLYQRLVEESGEAGLSITISGGSAEFDATEEWTRRTRSRIRGAERILVICGVHTDAAEGVAAELTIVREEGKPYLLLWGRRDVMCTKPAGAKATDGMYRWTSPTLQEQFALMSRVAQREAAAVGMKRVGRGETPPA
jgi:hypothetical protein